MAIKKLPLAKQTGEVPLMPAGEVLKIKGKLFYNDNARAWNIIRLKKEIMYEFPELRDKNLKFGYTMVLPRSAEAMRKHLQEVEKSSTSIPIFIVLNKLPPEEKIMPSP